MAQQVLATPNAVRLQISPAEADIQSRIGPYKWIVHPAVDIFLCCGGAVWLHFTAHYFFAAPMSKIAVLQALAIFSVLGTHMLGETHIAATLTRIYGSARSRQKFQTYTLGMMFVFAMLGVAGLVFPNITPLLAKAYLLLIAQHFTAQTYGIVLLYCYKSGYQLSMNDKFVLRWLLNITALLAIVRQFTYRQYNGTGFLAQPVPFWGPLPESVVYSVNALLLVLIMAFAGMLAKNVWRNRQLMPLPAVLTLVTGVAIFAVGRDQSGIIFLYAPAFYHGSQYVALSLAYYLKDRGLPADIPAWEISKACIQPVALKYMGLLLLVASAIYIALPRLLEEFGIKYTVAFATIFLVFNLHHFVTDMAIWKMRDPETKKLLVT
jgi:hypothetical protein